MPSRRDSSSPPQDRGRQARQAQGPRAGGSGGRRPRRRTLVGALLLATGAFAGVIAGEAAIFAAFFFTKISFLWYNVIGCLVVVAVASAYSATQRGEERA